MSPHGWARVKQLSGYTESFAHLLFYMGNDTVTNIYEIPVTSF